MDKKYNLTQTGNEVQRILNSAKNTDQVLTEIQEAMENLPDGQAVSAQVALNTAAIEELSQMKLDISLSVVAEALLYLYSENKALRELLAGKDNAVLPYIKAQTIECVDKMTMGVPDVLVSSVAGAPSATNIPDNWNEETMTVWDGCPRKIGQQYVDKESKKVYYAVTVTGSTSDWVVLN
jgi:hypothetical protein